MWAGFAGDADSLCFWLLPLMEGVVPLRRDCLRAVGSLDGSMEMMRAGLVDAACEPLGKLPSLSRPLCRAWVTYGRAPPRKRVGMGGRTGDMRRGAEGKEGGGVWT